MRISEAGLCIIKEFEGFKAKAYIPVPGDVPTIGYGFTEGVKMGDTMTREEADRIMVEKVLPDREDFVEKHALAPNQNQFDAMVSLCYNIGAGNFKKSQVLALHNQGNFAAAGKAFLNWTKSGGKVIPGLVRRRNEEMVLYLAPVYVVTKNTITDAVATGIDPTKE